MTRRQKRIRDAKIYELWARKALNKTDLAHRYNLSWAQVHRIITTIENNPHYKSLLAIEDDIREREGVN